MANRRRAVVTIVFGSNRGNLFLSFLKVFFFSASSLSNGPVRCFQKPLSKDHNFLIHKSVQRGRITVEISFCDGKLDSSRPSKE